MRSIFRVIAAVSFYLVASQANAQVSTLVWDVQQLATADISTISLDIRLEGTYILVNGVAVNSQNGANAAVGSCYALSSGDAICELQVRSFTYVMTIRDDLNGTLRIRGSGDTDLDEGVLIYRQ